MSSQCQPVLSLCFQGARPVKPNSLRKASRRLAAELLQLELPGPAVFVGLVEAGVALGHALKLLTPSASSSTESVFPDGANRAPPVMEKSISTRSAPSSKSSTIQTVPASGVSDEKGLSASSL
jgi:hypothetical protein